MIGVAPLRLGIGSFHAMFSSVDHFVGSPFSLLMPLACGPRHAGQFSACNVATRARQLVVRTARNRFGTGTILQGHDPRSIRRPVPRVCGWAISRRSARGGSVPSFRRRQSRRVPRRCRAAGEIPDRTTSPAPGRRPVRAGTPPREGCGTNSGHRSPGVSTECDAIVESRNAGQRDRRSGCSQEPAASDR